MCKEDLGKKVIAQEDSKDVQEKEGKMMKKDNKRRPVEPKLNREVKEKEAAKKEKEDSSPHAADSICTFLDPSPPTSSRF